LKVTDEMSRIRILIQSRIGAGSVSQRFGSEDPDPYQNVTDLEHWYAQLHISHKLLYNVSVFRIRFRIHRIHVFLPPRSGSGSTSQRYGSRSGSGSFHHHGK